MRRVMVAWPQVALAVGGSNDQVLVHSTDLSGTQVMVGVVGSSTVTVWLHSAVLPQASVARQVRVAAKGLAQCPGVLVAVVRMAMFTLPEVSVAMGTSEAHVLAC